MVEPGEPAPPFSLPTLRDGTVETVSLESMLGREVVVLAFYPGDFNPACTGGETGLDGLDLLTMQKDVRVLAVSGDSVFSHRAFADRYGLHMPLLSDSKGTVATQYGVAAEDGVGYLVRRAVFVVDHEGTVQFAWRGESPSATPPIDRIRRAIEAISDDGTAESRYRVGHAHYIEGRRAFTSAMRAYERREWLLAQTDFERAAGEFDEAGDEFDTAARFAESPESEAYFERAETKSEALWRAADWLADSANAFASGDGARAESLRADAESPLETARELDEPPDPDEFPPGTGDDTGSPGEPSPVVTPDDAAPASLDADIGEVDTGALQTAGRRTDEQEKQADERTGRADGPDDDRAEASEEIDDAELAEITAELEEQTEAAENEFDLAESDRESDEDEGDHGVPESL
ncbi:MAG: redoxin domain-containing protein [Natrialbaceae archaeon]